ncbi:hypothetical protein [Stenotrophomonas maltophilia]|uniref:hypothetical protein n=1 Tax=Stenotrophomonas maltophilia TaxID=40324 RepID=UPI00066BBE2E
MFGWLKPKLPFGLNDSRALPIAQAVTQLLKLQLVACGGVAALPDLLRRPMVRGYVVGIYDAAAQLSGLRLNDERQFLAYMQLCHAELLRGVLEDPAAFAAASLLTQAMPEFMEGQELGGREYFQWSEDRSAMPMGLARWLH